MILVDRLPTGALTRGHEGWGVDQELAAETVELLHASVRMLRALNSQLAGKRPKKIPPLQLPRPDYLVKKPAKKKPAQRMFDAIKTKGGDSG